MLNELSSCLYRSPDPEIGADVRQFYPLPEECTLQAFLPLRAAQQKYNFKMVTSQLPFQTLTSQEKEPSY
jgi:hypothetical protein